MIPMLNQQAAIAVHCQPRTCMHPRIVESACKRTLTPGLAQPIIKDSVSMPTTAINHRMLGVTLSGQQSLSPIPCISTYMPSSLSPASTSSSCISPSPRLANTPGPSPKLSPRLCPTPGGQARDMCSVLCSPQLSHRGVRPAIIACPTPLRTRAVPADQGRVTCSSSQGILCGRGERGRRTAEDTSDVVLTAVRCSAFTPSQATSTERLPPQQYFYDPSGSHGSSPYATFRPERIPTRVSETGSLLRKELETAGASKSSKQQKLEIGELQLGFQMFDPSREPLRRQILSALGASPASSLHAAKNCGGGVNEGIWFLKDGSRELALKLVRFDRLAPTQLIEAATFIRMYNEFPNIISDPSLSFPSHIFYIRGHGGARRHDLIVMPRAAGSMVSDIIASRCRAGDTKELADILEAIGASIAAFHHRYEGKQHCDLGAENVYFDVATQHTTLIDLGGMGNKVSCQDVERFCKIVRRMCEFYGRDIEDGISRFKSGYARVRAELAEPATSA